MLGIRQRGTIAELQARIQEATAGQQNLRMARSGSIRIPDPPMAAVAAGKMKDVDNMRAEELRDPRGRG